MHKLFSSFFALAIIYSSLSFSQSFKTGNNFSVLTVKGEVRFTCYDNQYAGTPPSYALFDCEDQVLDPVDYDYFVDQTVDADNITLTSHRSDGKTVTKSSGFEKGQSLKRFNLWIQTITQKPLLNFGDNNIEYVFSKNSQTVKSGNFNITVTSGKTSTCPSASFVSYSQSDCMDSYSACSRYFNYYNYCQ